MKRATLAILIILFSFTVNADESTDIKAGLAFDMGYGATVLINDKFSLMLGHDGIAADYVLMTGGFNPSIPFTWYIAGGSYGEWDDGFGARLSLGIKLHIAQNWNAYTQLTPDIGFDYKNKLIFGSKFAIGFRYQF